MEKVDSAEVVICGAGIAGAAAADFLATVHGIRGVLLVDERPPLSLTSDKSTEGYRNWWPGPDDAMIRLMNRSIDLLEQVARESGNRIQMNRRGYAYISGEAQRIPEIAALAEATSAMGAGSLRVHERASTTAYHPPALEGYQDQPSGADLLLEPRLIRQHFPYLSPDTKAVLLARRCGWFSGQQLGMYLLESAREYGARLVQGRVEGVVVNGGQVTGVEIGRDGIHQPVRCNAFVNAAGPYLRQVGRLMELDLPVFCELHLMVFFPDSRGVVRREAPMLIWEDSQQLEWNAEEQEYLGESEETRRLLGKLPGGAHTRPEGAAQGNNLLLLWPYHTAPVEPVYPLPEDPLYPEMTLRGLVRMIPGLGKYLERLPRVTVDGGYYTKTAENRLLSGPLPVPGAYVLGALSGYGLMGSMAAAELLALHLTGGSLPDYAPAFSLERYLDPGYQDRLSRWVDAAQL